jgi:hypothetical protein
VKGALSFEIEVIASERNFYYYGETVIVWVRVKNTGTTNIPAYDLQASFILVSPSGRTYDAGAGGNSPGFGPGQITVIKNNWGRGWIVPNGAEGGWYTARVTITSRSTGITRSRQENNLFSVGKPIRVSTSLTVRLNPSTITENTPTDVRIEGRLTRTDTGAGIDGKTVYIAYANGRIGSAITSSGGYYNYIWSGVSLSRGDWRITVAIDGDTQFSPSANTAVLRVIPGTQPPAPSFDFSISFTESVRQVQPGQQFHYTVVVKLISGTAQKVTLSVSGLPSGVSASFHDINGPPTWTGVPTFYDDLWIKLPQSISAGTYRFTVVGTSGSLTRSAIATFIVGVPPIEAQEPRITAPSYMYAGGECTVSVTGITDGLWTVINYQGNPLDAPIVKTIPPTTLVIDLSVQKVQEPLPPRTGIIKVIATRFKPEPPKTVSANINVIKYDFPLYFPSQAHAGSAVTVSVTGVSDGLWIITPKEGSPLDVPIVVENIPPNSLRFTPVRAGRIQITAVCFKPGIAIKKGEIQVISQPTTTTVTTYTTVTFIRRETEVRWTTVSLPTTVTHVFTQTVRTTRTVTAPAQTVTSYVTGIVTVTSYSPTITKTIMASQGSYQISSFYLGILSLILLGTMFIGGKGSWFKDDKLQLCGTKLLREIKRIKTKVQSLLGSNYFLYLPLAVFLLGLYVTKLSTFFSFLTLIYSVSILIFRKNLRKLARRSLLIFSAALLIFLAIPPHIYGQVATVTVTSTLSEYITTTRTITQTEYLGSTYTKYLTTTVTEDYEMTITPTKTIWIGAGSTTTVYVPTTTTTTEQITEERRIIRWIDWERFGRIMRKEGEWYQCGHLTIANMINYYVGRIAVTPEDVESRIWFGKRPLLIWEVEWALNSFSQEYALDKHATMMLFDINTVIKEVDNNRPVVLQTGLGGPGGFWGHSTIIVAYDITLSPDGRIIKASVYTYDHGFFSSDNLGWVPNLITFN